MEYPGWKSSIIPRMEIPGYALDKGRGQYSSPILLETMLAQARENYDRILGITDRDIFVPQMNFVFGLADMEKGAAVVSLARLRQEFYGQKADEELFIRRSMTEVIHELGHTWGLPHCRNAQCVMHFSNSLADTDHKGYTYCAGCFDILKQNMGK